MNSVEEKKKIDKKVESKVKGTDLLVSNVFSNN